MASDQELQEEKPTPDESTAEEASDQVEATTDATTEPTSEADQATEPQQPSEPVATDESLTPPVTEAAAEQTASSAPMDVPVLTNDPGTSTSESEAGGAGASIEMLKDVDLNVKIELGRARMVVEDVLKLVEGSVVELDKLAGDPVDIFVNERLVARGEVLVLNDNFCVRVSHILTDAV